MRQPVIMALTGSGAYLSNLTKLAGAAAVIQWDHGANERLIAEAMPRGFEDRRNGWRAIA